MEPERHPTLADVARLAEVATSTASRALQEDPRISELTRVRVRAAARGLGYRPNRIAQSLRTRTAKFVGIVVPDIGLPFYSHVVKGAQDVLESAGHQVLTMNTERESAREVAALQTLAEHRVGGLLIATSGGNAHKSSIPTVYFDNIVPNHGVANVASANAAGIALLVEHLIGHGHTRIAYIGGPPTFTSGLERQAGFREAVRNLAGSVDAYVEECDAVWSPQSGAAAMQRLIALDEPPTAVVMSGDTLALGAMSACRQAGLRLPNDMALVSFDDPPFGDLLDPPVTALTRNEREMGRLAATLLLNSLEGRAAGAPTEVRLPGQLVIRRSCGCP